MEQITFLEALDFMKRFQKVYILIDGRYKSVTLKSKISLFQYETTFQNLFNAKWYIE